MFILILNVCDPIPVLDIYIFNYSNNPEFKILLIAIRNKSVVGRFSILFAFVYLAVRSGGMGMENITGDRSSARNGYDSCLIFRCVAVYYGSSKAHHMIID